MKVRVRFAPSPSGYLHVGGARTALYNYLFARAHGGTFVLRVEDTDAARSSEESVRAILDSMRWLGLSWDEGPGVGGPYGPYFQSERRDHYQRHAAALGAVGRAYPCYCTPGEIDAMREAQAAAKQSLRYDGRCRGLDAAGRARLEAEGRKPALRFALDPAGETAWDDVVRGRVAFQNELLDDFVLLRSDGLPTYNFACVVDDHEMDITHVIRGDDHISNTPRQLLLYRAFGWEPPVLAHASMILGPDGSRLSKRHGATSVEAFRDLGIVPAALDNFLALLGWAYDDKTEIFTLAELERVFKLERVGSNPSTFNPEKLEWINGQHLKRESEETRTRRGREFLAGRGVDVAAHDDAWWTLLVRALGERLKTLVDAESYGRFALEERLEIEPEAWAGLIERPGVGERLDGLAQRLEADPEFAQASLERITREYAVECGLKAGELIGLARVALTGRKISPGIFEVMLLLGRARAVARLREAAARWRREIGAARG
jgi:nondiscriminating glutamyl-tRNA synthetase